MSEQITSTQVRHTTPPPPADAAAAGISVFTVAVLLLGLQFTDAIPATSGLAFIPMLFVCGLTQLIVGAIAVKGGDHVIGLFFCTFGPFLLSFAALNVGLIHGWWPVPATDLAHVQGAFLIGWTAVLSLWLLLSVVLPLFFSLLLLLINGALWTLVGGIWNSNADLEKASGWLLLACAVGGGYFMASRWLKWEGLDVLPLGRALVRARHGDGAF